MEYNFAFARTALKYGLKILNNFEKNKILIPDYICEDVIDPIKFNNLELTLPHNELTKRNFILFPLQEISPNWKHPKTKEFISDLLQKLSEDDKNSILKIDKN